MALSGSAGGAGARSLGPDPLPRGAARRGPRCCERGGRSPHRSGSGAENEPRDTAGERPQGLQLHPAPSRETPPDKAAAGGYQATGGALATALRSLCLARPRADAESDRPPRARPLARQRPCSARQRLCARRGPASAPPALPPTAWAVPPRPAELLAAFPRPGAARGTGPRGDRAGAEVQLGGERRWAGAAPQRLGRAPAGGGRAAEAILGEPSTGNRAALAALPGAPLTVTDRPARQSRPALLRLQPMSERCPGKRPAHGRPRAGVCAAPEAGTGRAGQSPGQRGSGRRLRRGRALLTRWLELWARSSATLLFRKNCSRANIPKYEFVWT
ncbi:translation initiation factor IF-2 [Pipra filicauda]|uniref:Translation initiation factor IF-2 n=1 Tax=Pipra filicauda TaxID=649802 RepID=A0A7R5KBH1_9PASS|nr:translation initiation factor IF-2 [Pipra filicauda]